MALSQVPDHPKPDSRLEQVRTPGDIAAFLLKEGAGCGDIVDRTVVDLGAGTGVLGLGAALLDAAFCVLVDIDKDAVAEAERQAERLEVVEQCSFHVADVATLGKDALLEWAGGSVDTVVMNPPFGADLVSRQRGGDRVFLGLAYQVADVVLSIHPLNTERFLGAFAADAGFEIVRMARWPFPLPARFRHHQKELDHVDVGLYRSVRRGALDRYLPSD